MATCLVPRQESAEVIVARRVDGKPDPDEYLLERILSWANLSEAWKRVKANRGAPGVDAMPNKRLHGLCLGTLARDPFIHLCRQL